MGVCFHKNSYELLESTEPEPPPSDFFSITVEDIDGKPFSMLSLKDKKCILIVNVACKWGISTA